uniref:Uncharacterized protein n=1 Tax=Arundo donax TaxID=35708 RepID=A0A0A9HAM7_ARUDO
MDSVPAGWLLQNRTSIHSLCIYEAMSLESLPPSIRDLSDLKELYLHRAGKHLSLPDLPSSLKELCIRGCHSELEKKFSECGSPEWNKISHLRRVEIGNSYFIMGKKCSMETCRKLR